MSNKVTKEQLVALIDNSVIEEHTYHNNKELVISYLLKDRAEFSISSRCAVVDRDNFDIEIGRKLCRDRAIEQLWLLEGYLKQLELAGVVKFT